MEAVVVVGSSRRREGRSAFWVFVFAIAILASLCGTTPCPRALVPRCTSLFISE
jgi:hypothetical protein